MDKSELWPLAFAMNDATNPYDILNLPPQTEFFTGLGTKKLTETSDRP